MTPAQLGDIAFFIVCAAMFASGSERVCGLWAGLMVFEAVSWVTT